MTKLARSFRVALVVSLLAAVASLVTYGRDPNTPVVHIDAMLNKDLSATELANRSDLVVDALVQTRNDYDLINEPHLVSAFNAEQQLIVGGGYRVREWRALVTSWIKGSSPSQIRIVAGLGGESVGMDPSAIDISSIAIGQVYRFYLTRDQVWFTGSDHYVLGVARSPVG